MRFLKQNTPTNLMIFMSDSLDHISGKTGLTLAVQISQNGGAFAPIASEITERGFGWYSVPLIAEDLDTPGDLALHITASGADATDLLCRVVPGSLDADISSRLATSGYTAPDNATIVNDLRKITGNKVTREGDVITIYQDNGTDVWRQYDIANGGRAEI